VEEEARMFDMKPTDPEPPWVQAKVDQLMAKFEDSGSDFKAMALSHDLVMMFLEEPREGASNEEIERWEHSCSNCNGWFPTTIIPGYVMRKVKDVQIAITFGACPRCLGRET
jgi:hypothetical protein